MQRRKMSGAARRGEKLRGPHHPRDRVRERGGVVSPGLRERIQAKKKPRRTFSGGGKRTNHDDESRRGSLCWGEAVHCVNERRRAWSKKGKNASGKGGYLDFERRGQGARFAFKECDYSKKSRDCEKSEKAYFASGEERSVPAVEALAFARSRSPDSGCGRRIKELAQKRILMIARKGLAWYETARLWGGPHGFASHQKKTGPPAVLGKTEDDPEPREGTAAHG